MITFLLSAGLGTRLRPLTNDTPKCLVPINGIPLIDYWLGLIKNIDSDLALINTHHLHDKIALHFKNINNAQKVKLLYEKKLLGSLGTLISNYRYYKDHNQVLVCYTDNLTNLNLNEFILFHSTHNMPVSMCLFESEYPENCGIVVMDSKGTIQEFQEKPHEPKSTLANAGIYLIDVKLLKEVKQDFQRNGIMDISNDFLGNHVGNIKGFKLKDILIDFGTISSYEYANYITKENPDLFKEIIST